MEPLRKFALCATVATAHDSPTRVSELAGEISENVTVLRTRVRPFPTVTSCSDAAEQPHLSRRTYADCVTTEVAKTKVADPTATPQLRRDGDRNRRRALVTIPRSSTLVASAFASHEEVFYSVHTWPKVPQRPRRRPHRSPSLMSSQSRWIDQPSTSSAGNRGAPRESTTPPDSHPGHDESSGRPWPSDQNDH